jgi:hypothetical protein
MYIRRWTIFFMTGILYTTGREGCQHFRVKHKKNPAGFLLQGF